MSDTLIRERTNDIEVPQFDDAPFSAAPELSAATVAVVTTAGLQRPGEPGWKQKDQSFRVFETGEQNLTISHLSPNFDRSGFVADPNVVYPIGRLEELAADGTIAAVAPRHLSFMGAQDETMATIRNDSGPAAAKLLREDGVNVVLLTPV